MGHFQYIFIFFKRGLGLDSGVKPGSTRPGLASNGRVENVTSSAGSSLLASMSFPVKQQLNI